MELQVRPRATKLDEFHLGPHQRLLFLALLEVPDLGQWAACSRAAASDLTGAVGEMLWNSVYDSTRRLRTQASEDVRMLVARPCGEAAVGCRAAVYCAARGEYLAGMVVAFDVRRNAYLVHYDEPPREGGACQVWEVDNARRDVATLENPSLASQSRFRFLTLPPDGGGSSSSSSSAGGGPLVQPGSTVLRLGSWRAELRHTAQHTPTKRVATIRDHADEVLFAAFSPCGNLLATCSRDKRTGIYRLTGRPGGVFSRVCMLVHESTALRAHWCPELPHRRLAISTGGPGELPFAEVWDIQGPRCVLKVESVPFDMYAAAVRWSGGGHALLAGGGRNFRRDGRQEMKVWRLPPQEDDGGEAACAAEDADEAEERPLRQQQTLLARLHLPIDSDSNHCHCPDPAPAGMSEGWVAGLTGSGPYQCDALVLFQLPDVVPPGVAEEPVRVRLEMHPLRGRAVLSVKWSRDGALLLANTRPHLAGSLERAVDAPPLSTGIELLVLDARTRETVSVHRGHFAFTTADAAFILHTDSWANNDLLASGGEDLCVHVWHRRHGRQLQRLEGHQSPVNSVSWSPSHRVLASGSDDHTVILWA